MKPNEMRKHLQTTITTVFGIDDGEGNVTPEQPLQMSVTKFNEGEFVSAYKMLLEKRNEVKKEKE